MASAKEVITLQVGHYSNFIGTHWWNIQESSFDYTNAAAKQGASNGQEVDHDVLFREGVTLMGHQTFTPRLVSIDLNGSLNTLKQSGCLYDVPSQNDDVRWPGDVTLHQMSTAKRNRYLKELEEEKCINASEVKRLKISADKDDNDELEMDTCEPSVATQHQTEDSISSPKLYDLDSSVKVWSDFLHTHLHPKSVYIVNEYQFDSDVPSFEIFGLGQQLWKDGHTSVEIEDRLHFFAEECDSIQGFQLLVDSYNGFGGLGTEILQYIQDEYRGKAILTFPVSPTSYKKSNIYYDTCRTLNTLLSLSKMSCDASVLTPLSLKPDGWVAKTDAVKFSHLDYKADLAYHTSAVHALALDTMSLLYRVDVNKVPLYQIADTLSTCGRKMAALGMSVPFPFEEEVSFERALRRLDVTLPWTMLTPYCSSSRGGPQTVVLRGGPTMEGSETSNELLDQYVERACPEQLSGSLAFSKACKVVAPFPGIFTPDVSRNGFISTKSSSTGVESVPVMTCHSSASDCYHVITELTKAGRRFNIHKFHKYVEAGLESDDFQEALASLETLAENYNEQTSAS